MQHKKERLPEWSWIKVPFFLIFFWSLAASICAGQMSEQTDGQLSEDGEYHRLTGADIMTQVFERHKLFPYVYEEQTMILTDNVGNRDVRQVRRFSRVESDGTMKYLLVFDDPVEVRGVAIRFVRYNTGIVENQIYLPALGKEVSSGQSKGQVRQLLGTDFALEDLVESLDDFKYVRLQDQTIGKIAHFVVEAFPLEKDRGFSGYNKRRLFIRQDNFFIVRTDYFDLGNRFFKQLTCHDLKRVDKKMWRANMLLMEDKRQQHTTLIKIDQRVFSRDYVPPEIFNFNKMKTNKNIGN